MSALWAPRVLTALMLLAVGPRPAWSQAVPSPEPDDSDSGVERWREWEDARVKMGPLAVAPAIRLTNLGYDSNVLSESVSPRSDLTATLSPSAIAFLRLPRLRVSGRTVLNYVHYNDLSRLSSADTVSAGRLDVFLNRLEPFVDTGLSNTRHDLNVEIDAPIRRREDHITFGANVRLTGKTAIELNTTRASTTFEDHAVYRDSDLSRALDRNTTGEAVVLRYALTPYTTVGIDLLKQQERFDVSSDRDADSTRIGPMVEFKPFALISGRAGIGIRKRTFLHGDLPPYRGTAMLFDLRYTLQDRTRVAIGVERDLKYSYRLVRQEYLLTGLNLSVSQRLMDPWDVRGSVSRSHLSYGNGESFVVGDDDETLMIYAFDVGYRVRGTRIGMRAEYRYRAAQGAPTREFDRFRVGASMAYGIN